MWGSGGCGRGINRTIPFAQDLARGLAAHPAQDRHSDKKGHPNVGRQVPRHHQQEPVSKHLYRLADAIGPLSFGSRRTLALALALAAAPRLGAVER